MKDGEAIVEQIISSMVRALQAGDNLEIRGLSRLNPKHPGSGLVLFPDNQSPGRFR